MWKALSQILMLLAILARRLNILQLSVG